MPPGVASGVLRMTAGGPQDMAAALGWTSGTLGSAKFILALPVPFPSGAPPCASDVSQRDPQPGPAARRPHPERELHG
jgi:hypothetical protein